MLERLIQLRKVEERKKKEKERERKGGKKEEATISELDNGSTEQ